MEREKRAEKKEKKEGALFKAYKLMHV